MMLSSLICILSSFLWRVRGGLRFWGHKVPLNKVWFALFFGGAFCYLTQWSWNVWAIVSLATFVSYQAYGWGEYIGCLLTGAKPTDRSDCPLVDDIVDTLHWKDKKLTDYPVLFGWVGLSLRGLLMTYMIGLAIQNMPFMLTGLAMGTVYKLGGLLNKIKDDGKSGWNWAEWLWGLYMGAMLCALS